MKKVILSLVATVMFSMAYGQSCSLVVTNNTGVDLVVTGWSSNGVTNASSAPTGVAMSGGMASLPPAGPPAYLWIGLEVTDPGTGTTGGENSPCQGPPSGTAPWTITWTGCCIVKIS